MVQLTIAARVPSAFGWSLLRGGFPRTTELEDLGVRLGGDSGRPRCAAHSPRRWPTRRWSTRTPRATYGDALVDELLAARPDSLIWDTTERGKPDLLRLVQDECRELGAEAVLVVSNKAGTWTVVHGMERQGVPAIGPVWDS